MSAIARSPLASSSAAATAAVRYAATSSAGTEATQGRGKRDAAGELGEPAHTGNGGRDGDG